jgi:DNA ligase (NAD+)
LWKQSILSLSTWASLDKNRELLMWLEQAWVYFGPEASKQKTSSVLENKTFVITWSFEGHSRESLWELILEHGGTVSGSVSKKTSYLLAGEKAWSKYTKAQDAGVNILDLDGLEKLIGKTLEKKKNSTWWAQGSLFG